MAICLNELLASRNARNRRYIVATGVLGMSRNFFASLVDKRTIFDSSLFLLTGAELPSDPRLPVYGGVQPQLPDLHVLKKLTNFVTVPQFSYKCNYDATECIGFGKHSLCLRSSLYWMEYVNTFHGNSKLMDDLLRGLHSLRNYRECFNTCVEAFKTVENFNFQDKMVATVLRKSIVESRVLWESAPVPLKPITTSTTSTSTLSPLNHLPRIDKSQSLSTFTF